MRSRQCRGKYLKGIGKYVTHTIFWCNGMMNEIDMPLMRLVFSKEIKLTVLRVPCFSWAVPVHRQCPIHKGKWEQYSVIRKNNMFENNLLASINKKWDDGGNYQHTRNDIIYRLSNIYIAEMRKSSVTSVNSYHWPGSLLPYSYSFFVQSVILCGFILVWWFPCRLGIAKDNDALPIDRSFIKL